MTTTYITNATGGAPVLYGAVGSLIGVLDFCLVTTLGWTKSNTGVANKCTYRAPAGGNQFYLGVDDTATQNTRVRGFTAATAPTEGGVVQTVGTLPFPTDAQVNGGDYIYKSSTIDSTNARAWRFASDGKLFYLSIESSTSSTKSLFAFGDIISYKASDTHNVVLMGESAAATYTAGTLAQITAAHAGAAGGYLALPYTLIGSSQQCGKVVDSAFGHTAGAAMGGVGATYPSLVEGGILVSRVQICEGITSGSFRGRLPGLWAPMHARPLADADTFTGTGDLTGRTFVAWNLSAAGQVFIETSDTWST